MNCEFCDKTFSSKSNLVAHKKTAKYCLEMQGRPDDKTFECEFCNKILSQKATLLDHLTTCKERYKKLLEQKEIEYKTNLKKLEYEINKFKRIVHEYDEKERCHIEKITKLSDEKEKVRDDFQHKIKEIETNYTRQLEEKDTTITKLEAKLEKFENAVIANTRNRLDGGYEEDSQSESDEIPIPLKEQMSSIVIEETKKDEEIEYSNITLNNVVISSRPIDHYVNATQLCQAGGKKFNDWFRLDTTKELMNELSSDAGIPASLFVESNRGRTSKYTQGSWIHPDLSIQLAQWISPKFAIQVSKWIRSLFNIGSVEIDLTLLRDKDRNIRLKDHRIKQLEAICLSKQRRVEYQERNVIYMITTDDHLRRRTYIIGKTKNLTQRLSTYNKTCDHTVVHYRECKNDEDMDTAETLVLNKLRDYREQANRDRFILPDDKNISFFTSIIDECIEFI